MRKLIGFVNVLSEVLRAGSPRGIEHALLVLNYLCSDSREMAFTAIKEGILDLCSVLAGHMNPNIGKNAMELVLRLEKEQFGGYS
ncbi:hypothetical protein OPV22_021470 [Ensete ventricosum]|uniref:Uncharacterized protein n=2 Tax=Ensete ventricosum TaxID=4639 RepID=A0AAV8QMI2_ENSVE|nr:hypothetical protein OPV22_021470 [Ensete ventricosum]